VTRRMGVALATAENVASARAKAVAAANRIKIRTVS
jgi:formate-dependent phosphoribosylglycinamide formyltransferase (GAR transformylase)